MKLIKKRPKEVYKRNTYGHWEADTVVSGRKNGNALSSYCFVTLAERKSRLYIAKHIRDRKDETVTNVIIELLKEYPKDLVKTITYDRGKWQKGTNENSNGLLKEYYPKGMDLSKTNNIELKEKLDLLKIIGLENVLIIKHQMS